MDFVTYDVADDVATLTISRPQALNALNSQVLSDLGMALDQAEADQARCLLITGAGRAFVAGADITEMAAMTPRQAEAFSRHGSAIFRRLEKLPIPSVAAVNGFALGGGCELAMSCDIRLASEKAVFGQPEVGLGVTAGFGGTQRLTRLVAPGVANELLFSGGRMNADRAFQVGLVNAVYPVDELLAAAVKLATSIALQSPVAVRATKQAVTLGRQTDIDTALAIESAQFASCFGTQDQVEGMGAFMEKRPPAPFTGC
ncbi:MAG: enoyl-CoA hydratase-related protein [Propionibacteriaceae bacterium]|nr:enoyl-CoA hydratase-related protein [Propionibacteriaceae bacterium]